jgi:phenylacetate-CoA ligase
VVVTDLHNFATPLIRYELGDHAEVGPPCPCGRGLPVLRRVLGRSRNMAVLPNGDKIWPIAYFSASMMPIAPVRQIQLVQTTVDHIDVKLVTARPLTDAEERNLKAYLLECLKHPFDLSFDYVDEIPRAANGKYEDFVSRVENRG